MSKTMTIESPKGSLAWVVISGEGKENLSGKMQYKADLILEGEAAEALKASIDEYFQENKPKGFSKAPKSTGYYPHKAPKLNADGTPELDENGKKVLVETGKTVFSFKTDTTWPKDGSPKLIKVFNSKGNPVQLGETKIGNGSVGRVLGAAGMYEVKAPGKSSAIIDAGVTLYLNAIKLLKLEEYVGGAAFSTSDDDAEYEAIGEEFVGNEEQSAEPARSRL
jgi:hypothetical protein